MRAERADDRRSVRPLFQREEMVPVRPLFSPSERQGLRPRPLFQSEGAADADHEDLDRRGSGRGRHDDDLGADPDAEHHGDGDAPPPAEPVQSAAQTALEAARDALDEERTQILQERASQTSLRQRYERSLETLVKAQAEEHSHLESELVDLAIEIAREIIQRELRVDRAHVVQLAAAALQVVAEEEAVTLLVAPDDVELIEAARARLTGMRTGLLRIVVDPSLEPGECVVQAGNTRVDGRLQDRLERVRRALHGVTTEAA